MDQQDQSRFIGIDVEGVLQPCEIYPISVAVGHGYVWEWSALEGSSRSGHTFDMFFDCLEDARRHGYEPHFLDAQHTTDISVIPVMAPS